MTCSGILALEAFAQQGAGGINNFVLLAVPFFMLTGFVMDANGMSVRLVNLLQHLIMRRSRRTECRHGLEYGDLFRRFRIQTGRRRGGRRRAGTGGARISNRRPMPSPCWPPRR